MEQLLRIVRQATLAGLAVVVARIVSAGVVAQVRLDKATLAAPPAEMAQEPPSLVVGVVALLRRGRVPLVLPLPGVAATGLHRL